VSVSELAEILVGNRVRQVILNACQSVRGDVASLNFARSLVQAGVSMALGMCYRLLNSAVQVFTAALYQDMLVRNQPLPAAAAYCRSALRTFSRRKTKYNTHILVQGNINPVLFTSDHIEAIGLRNGDGAEIGCLDGWTGRRHIWPRISNRRPGNDATDIFSQGTDYRRCR
jgi:hypothetical protein